MHQFIKTTAALAIVAAFGVAHAQPKVDDTVKQTQKPSSGTMPMPKTPAATPKVDDVVKETQKPSSGMQPAPMNAATTPKVDDTVMQTQKPGVAANGPEKTTKMKKKKHHKKAMPQS